MNDLNTWVAGLFIFAFISLAIVLFFAFQKLLQTKRRFTEAQRNLHKAQAHLIESEKLSSLGLFTAGISHEINNPINHISGGSQILFRMLENNEVTEREVAFSKKSILDGMEKVQHIISRLRTYSNSKSNLFVNYNIAHCVEDALILLKPLYMGKTKIENLFPETLELECVPSKISQLMVNVIGNAIEASTKKDKVSIRTERNDQTVTLVIEDTGSGIDSDHKDLIFDPFFSTKEGRLGLGLYSAYHIVQEHGGTIKIDSIVHEGTKLAIELPWKNANHNGQSHSEEL